MHPLIRAIRVGATHRVAPALAMILLLAACGVLPPQTTPTPPVLILKRLATVELTATPNDAQRQATRLAATATPSVATETAIPSPTVYVGFFLGDSAAAGPQVNGTRFAALAPPTATAIPSIACALPPNETVFGVRWQTNVALVNGLGCAIEDVIPFNGTTQVFEQGVMYFREGGAMWAIAPGEPGRFWFVEAAPVGEFPAEEAPPGLFVPQLGFGALWNGVIGVRAALGYATTREIDSAFVIQRFEGGTLLYEGEGDQRFGLLIDGTAYGPY